ncbi:LuxR C-terminal-related transcriptional regulator [Horticoccus luteus]|uniref:LuxR C-terminal-related transcriptional regulator n=1 Tax=Horticoccus luteus TaxID=2862869 RepID=A0A8F9TY63_9BACT|nr:LuxR C-terminal-related transcriptional regulator [Horticoccus luteus]QYM79697.1 LuxR C-terminal-related transcriptional regulator [Horticoccus luteus]
MPSIDPRAWRPLFDAVYEINLARDHADFTTAVLNGMSRLIPADVCHLHVIDRAAGRILHQSLPANPFRPEEIAYYVSHPEENAFVAYYDRTGDKHARRLCDVTDPVQYRRSEFYRHCLQRLGFRHTLVLPLALDEHTVAGLAFDRRRGEFTPRHCALLDAFAPHLLLAWRRYENPWQEKSPSTPSPRDRLRALGLTPRESDILFWMTEGKQNPEIAAILGRSLQTIQEHVANIVRKLGQENRHAATVFALRRLGRA